MDKVNSETKFAGWLGGDDGRLTAIWSGAGAPAGPETEELDAPFEEVVLVMASRGFAVEAEPTHGMRRIFRV